MSAGYIFDRQDKEILCEFRHQYRNSFYYNIEALKEKKSGYSLVKRSYFGGLK